MRSEDLALRLKALRERAQQARRRANEAAERAAELRGGRRSPGTGTGGLTDPAIDGGARGPTGEPLVTGEHVRLAGDRSAEAAERLHQAGDWALQAALASIDAHERAAALLERLAADYPGEAAQHLAAAAHHRLWAARDLQGLALSHPDAFLDGGLRRPDDDAEPDQI
ncbi:hypothetical protein [Actinomadura fibrosa]|uniref:Uncharacterized protein n=1 Tax=Actinomadura fibrosa TaxID=111802 RepID=A0ABW2XFY1_9ACTN|nr:hypothetical protein [Actinomadura fibrosa]